LDAQLTAQQGAIAGLQVRVDRLLADHRFGHRRRLRVVERINGCIKARLDQHFVFDRLRVVFAADDRDEDADGCRDRLADDLGDYFFAGRMA
jgi:hypothetical protein